MLLTCIPTRPTWPRVLQGTSSFESLLKASLCLPGWHTSERATYYALLYVCVNARRIRVDVVDVQCCYILVRCAYTTDIHLVFLYMQTKHLVFGVVLCALVFGVIAIASALYVQKSLLAIPPLEEVAEQNDTSVPSGTEDSSGKLKADTFAGVLEEVDTGCFADGECFVVVDGKRVTAIMGWSTETVGSIQGVDGFGDLEQYVGGRVEVYAQELPDGTYTLYGSEGFYIKTLGDATSNGSIESPSSNGVTDEAKPQLAGGGCVIAGCSSQLCVDASMGDIMTTCEYRAEYACYQGATCTRQADGVCGWTETAALTACIADARTNEGEIVY